MADNNDEYISSVTLPNGKTYIIRDTDAVRISDYEQGIANVTLPHKLTFGAGGAYVYDGSEDVTVPVYTGEMI